MAETPVALFGKVGSPLPDWRDLDIPDLDDVELEKTSPDIVVMLGFDPKAD